MAVGKAQAHGPEQAAKLGFPTVVPCLSSIREDVYDHLLAIVGTIFLPLSFITGFFGMNFRWLVVEGINSTWSFFVLGLGSMLATCVALVVLFKRKGWI